MDSNIEEYLAVRSASKELPSTDEFVDIYYERRISAYRSSTVMVFESWGDTLIVCGEETHYEEFI